MQFLISAVMALGRDRVAIIGAGISGLACAVELKRNGITPVVFEKTGRLGGALGYQVLVLRMFCSFQRDPVKYLNSRYNMALEPEYAVDEIIMKGPTRSAAIKGKHGYTFPKGLESRSIESQFASAANIDICFDSLIKLQDIENDFDSIVVATGNHLIPDELGLWNRSFRAHVRSAELLGEFNPGRITMWLNRTYSNRGYAYMMAAGRRNADLVLTVTDITARELDHYWRVFLKGEHIEHTVLQINDMEQHIGRTVPVRYGKLYFVGNAGGMIDNFLGIGIIRSIESGILAARSIAGKCDYNAIMKPYMADVGLMGEYRRMLDGLDNEGFDRLISFIGLPLVKQAIYNNPFYRIRHTAFIPKLLNRLKHGAY